MSLPKYSTFALALLMCVQTTQAHIEKEPVIGAVVGAGVGMAVADKAIVGAGIGAILGGLIGHAWAVQARDLNTQLMGSGIRIIDDKYGTSLAISTDMAFRKNNTRVLEPKYYDVLNQVVQLLQRYPHAKLSISGHSDDVAHEAAAYTRSQAFAKTITDYLLARGLAGERVLAVQGHASKLPIATNKTVWGRSLNRRVEITIHQHVP